MERLADRVLIMPTTARERRRVELLATALQCGLAAVFCAGAYLGVFDTEGRSRDLAVGWIVLIHVGQVFYMVRYRAEGRAVRWVEVLIPLTDVSAISAAWLTLADPASAVWIAYVYGLVGYSRRLRGRSYAVPAVFIIVNLAAVSIVLNVRDGLGAVNGNVVTQVVVSTAMAFMAHAIGSSWQRAEGRARELADTDPLTGIANRRTFLDRMEALTALPETGYSVLMLDLDNFKRVNDDFGHAEGDAALVTVARTLSDGLRACDLLARYGGEEFIALLPETGAGDALVIASELREAVAWTSTTTVSIGCATRGHGEPADAVLKRADDLLRLAKRSGKNTVRTDERLALSA